MSKHKVLVGFLGVAVLAAVLMIWDKTAEADAAYAYAELSLGKATEKIMNSNMPQSVKDKILLDLFADLPRMSEKAKLSLSRSNAAQPDGVASKSQGMGRDTTKLRGKSTEARKNVCKGLYRAYDNVKADGTARTHIQQHLTDRSCTR